MVSCSTNGVAAQAVAVSHALNSEALHGDIGLVSASARDVADSVHALATNGLLWTEPMTEPPVNTVALLDPLTVLAVLLSYVNIDGSIALMPDDILDESCNQDRHCTSGSAVVIFRDCLAKTSRGRAPCRWIQAMGSRPGRQHLLVFQQLCRETWCQRTALRGLSWFAHGG